LRLLRVLFFLALPHVCDAIIPDAPDTPGGVDSKFEDVVLELEEASPKEDFHQRP
jgi:hypothetical protein